MRSQRPPAPRKVSRPLSRDTPAPENTTTRSASRTRSRTGGGKANSPILFLFSRWHCATPPATNTAPMPHLPNTFGLLEPAMSDYETSRVAVLPVPFERTTSYGKGTTSGPAAILRASQAMELYDEELAAEPYVQGIATLPPFLPEAFNMEEGLAELQEACKAHMEQGKFLVTLGGEHSLTQAPVKAAREVFGEIGVVQFDAHTDLREEFEGTPYSHASVMKRVVDAGIPTLAVGIRSLSAPEAELVRERSLP